MPMRVRDLIDDPALGLDLLVEQDIDRPVRWVHTTELADPSLYLQGGEVILTTGVWIDAGTKPADFVRPLAEAGVAALGYGIPRPDATVPAGLSAACRRRRLTFFTVPYELPFIAIAEAFVERLAADREEALQRTVRHHAALVRAAEHDTGLDGMLRVLADGHGIRSWVVGRDRQVLAQRDVEPASEDVEAVAAEASRLQAEYPIDVRGWQIFPIVAVGRTEAHLVVAAGGGRLSIEDRAAIDQTLPYLGLELARRRALRESERRFAAELIDLVHAGPPQLPATAARLEAFGIDPHAAMVGMVCEGVPLDDAVEAVDGALLRHGVAGVVASKGMEVVAIAGWNGDDQALADIARDIAEVLSERAAVGVGGVASSADSLRTSLLEARHACRFARLRRQGRAYVVHGEVGSHTLLLAMQDEEVLAAFRRALLRPLEEHDARRHTQLVETLDTFLSSGGQWQATADRLHVHVNTLRHRLARVEQLTGRTLSSMEDRVDFFIALRAGD
jgi:PucR family transcriptional regulator, purine catabolism regulatory protein